MIIIIAGLSEGTHNYRFEDFVQKLGLDSTFFKQIEADVELNKSHNQIILSVNLKAAIVVECDRCTKVFEQQLNSIYKVIYFFGNKPVDTNDANIIYLPLDADKINIAPEMHDYALLAVPMKKLCSDDCKGLCPKCGNDLNESECSCEKEITDSRWLPLLDLKDKLSNN